jgi:hypothetical protein
MLSKRRHRASRRIEAERQVGDATDDTVLCGSSASDKPFAFKHLSNENL